MTKRIVSGIFILTALGALGVILAGALTSGEQLIVRFLTAVIVAALGLYVISDLRLQADDDAAGLRTGTRPRLAGIDAPPNSTAAFMATVTGRGEAPTEVDAVEQAEANQDELAEDVSIALHASGVGAASSSTSERDASAVVEDAGSPDGQTMPSILGPAPVTVRASDLPELAGKKPATITDLFSRRSDEPFDESADEQGWPTITGQVDHVAVTNGATMTTTITAPDLDRLNGAVNGHGTGNGNANGNGDHGPDDHGDHHGPDDLDDEIELLVEPDEERDELRADVDPVVDFEYSGDLDAPDYASWPAPAEPIAEPEQPTIAEPERPRVIDHATADPVPAEPTTPPSAAVETLGDPEGPEPIAADTEAEVHTEAEADGTAAEPGDASGGGPSDAAAEPQEPSVPTADDADPTTDLNGSPAALPAPFGDNAELMAADYADAPLAPIIDLRDVNASSAGVEAAIQSGEVEVISALIEQGMLSTEGPISDRDVRTMVYVAFTSNELRKLLLAGGSPDQPNPEIDLGPVELFDADIEVPKALYNGQPALPAEARSQLG
ncbi:MAG: hypothetical protein AAGA93_04620 [Actinomycetota bacterium]